MKIINCIILVLTILAVGVPNLAVAEYKVSYKVKGECNRYISELEKYDWGVALAVQVFEKESGCKPEAHNPEAHYNHDRYGNRTTVLCYGSENIPQIGCGHYKKGEDKRDYKLAIAKAHKIWVDNGRSFKGKWGACKLVKNCL